MIDPIREAVAYERLRGLVAELRAHVSAQRDDCAKAGFIPPTYVGYCDEAATEIEALLDGIAKLEEACDYYAGLYAERCGMLLKSQCERDAAEKRLSEAEKVIETFERLEQSIMSDIKAGHSRGPGASEWMREDDREMRAEIRAAFKAARALLTQETDNGK